MTNGSRHSLDRRSFLRATAATAAIGVGTGPAVTTGTAQANSEPKLQSRFGYPIESEWNAGGDVSRVRLGTINGDQVAASFISLGEYSTESQIGILDRDTGQFSWEIEVDAYVFGPSLHGDVLYYNGADEVVAHDVATDTQKWTYTAPRSNVAPLLTSATHVYVVSYREERQQNGAKYVPTLFDATLTALNRETGRIDWRKRTDRMFWYPGLSDGTLYVRANETTYENNSFQFQDGYVYAFDAETGDLQWKTRNLTPDYVTPMEKGVVVHDTDNTLFGYTTDGTQEWQHHSITTNYFVADGTVVAGHQDGGFSVIDLATGTVEAEEHRTSTVTDVHIGDDNERVYLGTSDGVQARTTDNYTVGWETHLPSEPESTFEVDGILCVKLANKQVVVLDAATGEQMWTETYSATTLSTRVSNGLLYISGNRIGVRAVSGAQYRAQRALTTAQAQSESVSGMAAAVLGRDTLLERAQTAFKNNDYERTQTLVAKAERRQHVVQGAMGMAGLGSLYGGSRKTAAWRERRALTTACETIQEQYPIETGALKGVEPRELLAQAETAKDAIQTTGIESLRASLRGDTEYRMLATQLEALAERAEQLRDVSAVLADHDSDVLPEMWVTELRHAIQIGEIDTVDTIVDDITTTTSVLERLEDVQATIERSALPITDPSSMADTVLAAATALASDSDAETVSEQTLIAFLTVVEEVVETYEEQHTAFDLSPVVETITANLTVDAGSLTEARQTLEQARDTIEAATTVHEHLTGTDFTMLEADRDKYVTRTQGLVAQLAAGQLQALANELEQLRYGRWKTEDFYRVSPTGFEHIVGALFADMGYESFVTQETADKGVDVIARNPAEVLAIQVKQYKTGNTVGRPAVQQLVGAMAQAGADRAVIVTTSGFTNTAVEAAAELGDVITLVNQAAVQNLLTESNLMPPSSNSHTKYKEYHESQTERTRQRSHTTGGTGRQSQSQSQQRARGESASMSSSEARRVLGVSESASQPEIKRAYRNRVKETHPDVSDGSTTKEFKRVQMAYSVLGNGT